jgi:uncharacterized protein YukE
MKVVYTMFVAILLILPACNRNDRDRVRADTPTTDQLKQQRDDYTKSVEAKLAEFDQKFDGLDARAKAMNGRAKDDFQNAVDGLRAQRKTVSKKVDDLKNVSVDSWMTLKGEVDTAVADLDKSYEQVAAANETAPTAAPKNGRSAK